MERTADHNTAYSNPDNDPNGLWRSGDYRSPNLRLNLKYDIATPTGKIIPPPDKGWRWDKQTVLDKINIGEIVFNSDETKTIRKIYLKNQIGRVPESIWFGNDVGTTREANSILKAIFEEEIPFNTPKPSRLIEQIIKLSTNPNSIILDSFAGSGTTAHAVLNLNKQDGGNRKFILIEMEDYAETITAERVKRVINGFINHYPDFVIRTKGGKTLVLETKGDHLDAEPKIRLGNRWASKAGNDYRYFMVYENCSMVHIN